MSEDTSDNISQISQTTTSTRQAATPRRESRDDEENIIRWVDHLKDESTREAALSELSRKRETFADLAIYIWYSTGTVSAL